MFEGLLEALWLFGWLLLETELSIFGSVFDKFAGFVSILELLLFMEEL
jgi:hypothetical protein